MSPRKIEETWRVIRHRDGVDELPAHLERRYGLRVANLTPLDAGVYRVDPQDGPRLVARLFPAVRPLHRAEGDADILRFLEQHDFPSERLAHIEPLSMHEGQALLMTRFIDGGPLSDRSERTFNVLGDMLGRMHCLPESTGGCARPGGAIHSFTLDEGSLRDEVAAAMSWLEEAEIPERFRALYDSMIERISRLDFGDRLPQALLHPDPVPKNFIATRTGDVVPIDWTGAGRGPRAHSLAFLLLCAVRESRWNPNSGRVDAVVDGCASFCMGRTTFDEVAGGYSVISRLGATVAERARRAFHA
jgi:Ser/Thr protein kinase RdoA (MazF antagonist)